MHTQKFIHGRRFEVLISESQIHARLGDICHELNLKYKGKKPVFLAILNGAFIFASDVVRCFEDECEISFVKIKSYHGTESTGNVEIVMPPQIDLKGRHVVILEDIVDTGQTLSAFLPLLQEFEPASVELVALLVKPEVLEDKVKVDMVCFPIENKFVVGYGLDYDGIGRNLRDIYVLVE